MRFLTDVVLNAVTGSTNGPAVDATQALSASFVGTFSDGAAAGTMKFQGSNDKETTPTTWVDVPSGSVAVTGGAASTVTIPTLCFQWVRVVWTQSGGAGTITAKLHLKTF